jgi:hypothetical protein
MATLTDRLVRLLLSSHDPASRSTSPPSCHRATPRSVNAAGDYLASIRGTRIAKNANPQSHSARSRTFQPQSSKARTPASTGFLTRTRSGGKRPGAIRYSGRASSGSRISAASSGTAATCGRFSAGASPAGPPARRSPLPPAALLRAVLSDTEREPQKGILPVQFGAETASSFSRFLAPAQSYCGARRRPRPCSQVCESGWCTVKAFALTPVTRLTLLTRLIALHRSEATIKGVNGVNRVPETGDWRTHLRIARARAGGLEDGGGQCGVRLRARIVPRLTWRRTKRSWSEPVPMLLTRS